MFPFSFLFMIVWIVVVVVVVEAFIYQSTHTWKGIRNQVHRRRHQQHQLLQPQLYYSITNDCYLSSLSRIPSNNNNNNNVLTTTMRDVSASYWFNVGDQVKVIDDVFKAGNQNLYGLQGRVIETWEKCDVDPTCCCAEFVDENFAVRVEFINITIGSTTSELLDSTTIVDDETTFTHYFAESELIKIKQEEEEGEDSIVATNEEEEEEEGTETEPPADDNDLSSTASESSPTSPAFDGMSCVAFKLDQLKMGQQAQRLAAFEESRRDSQQQQQQEE